MLTKKMYERINWYRKEYVYEQYARIVESFKDYDRISRKKIVEEIYKVYNDYNNIISICTTRELEYLKKILDKKQDMKELLNKKYKWERNTLKDKFLLQEDFEYVFIPDEIMDKVKEAIKNVDWNMTKKLDYINEVLVSYCKIEASSILVSVWNIVSAIAGIDEKVIKDHIIYNKVFNYYVYVHPKNIESLGDDILVAVYRDYYGIEDMLDEERKKQGLIGSIKVDRKRFKTLFYNDFDMNNKKVKKMLEEIKKLPFFWNKALDEIRNFAVLNIDRTPLKEAIENIPALKDHDLTPFFKVLDEAMDEMPSGALNGLTPNEAKEIMKEREKINLDKERRYIKQQNACLSKKDADLFYKIYFGLLEFTNNKYKIKNNLKIYKQKGIDPYEIREIVEKFWKNKDEIIEDFCKSNPYKFNKEKLQITSDFKNGIREIFIIAKFEEEYTALMSKDRIYMIKGINDNIDNVISYEELPTPVLTTIIPFKNVLIYDSLLATMNTQFGIEFDKAIEDHYDKLLKYYHL